jgi:hypothetical protein
MNQARLEWVISGLNQYALTKNEDHFIKTAQEGFDKTQALTDSQEARLETLYKEKSKMVPNKDSNRFSVKESTPKKIRPRKPFVKDVLIAS